VLGWHRINIDRERRKEVKKMITGLEQLVDELVELIDYSVKNADRTSVLRGTLVIVKKELVEFLSHSEIK
jgi:hypothetical protein